MKFELEKVRRWDISSQKDWEEITIKKSENMDELLEIAKTIKLKKGKTFYEVLCLLTYEDGYDGDIYDNEILKDSLGDDGR